MIALDTETTGVDFHHGCRAFFVSTCDEDGEQRVWQWPVDPFTRAVEVPEDDLRDIGEYLLGGGQELVFHNAKFDMSALRSIGLWELYDEDDAWAMVRDTLLLAHLRHSNQPKDLTSLASEWLGEDISELETALEHAVKACRLKVQHARGKTELGSWRIATDDDPMLPSSGEDGKLWRADYWLPKAYAVYTGLPEDHEYHTVLQDYAVADPAITLKIYEAMGGMR